MKNILSILALFVSIVSFASADDGPVYTRQIDNQDYFTISVNGRGWHKDTGVVSPTSLVARSNNERVTVIGSVISSDGISITVNYNGYGRKFVRTLFVKNDELNEVVAASQMATDPMKIVKIDYQFLKAITFTDEKGMF
jgi:hypothetical protein